MYKHEKNPPSNYDNEQFVRDHLPIGERLTQLAEEAAELAQAALKLRRAYDGTNPTPVSVKEATAALLEEYADVRLCIKVLNLPGRPATIYDMMDRKVARWADRLRAADTGGAARGEG